MASDNVAAIKLDEIISEVSRYLEARASSAPAGRWHQSDWWSGCWKNRL